ncbi:hypothetical protein C9374_012676 [Naegleria lovaniensis]|uniref:Glutathione S-transferase n=1 Tax=Naegleria lovaniensis TaxID=51637 RepID=A0AA88KR71_NAELO|nr:uncharacterized protein C9374_012676 [Naegleria lovaniensis]KAG2392424.1 hypothetical protein C9374_012676 [Naegleria lovaniensis]
MVVTVFRPMEKKYATNGWRVRLMLEEKAVKYETRLVILEHREHLNEEIRKLSYRGELPLFEDFSGSVREETAMLNYIEKNYPEPPLIPSPEKDRAFYGKILSWFHEANGAFAQTCKDMINTFIELEEKNITSHKKLPKEMKDYKTLVQYWKQKIESEMVIWENRLGNEMTYFNDSDRPSIVDVSLFPYYYQIVRYGLNEQNLPKLKKWRERMEERESVKRTSPTGWQVHPFLLKF